MITDMHCHILPGIDDGARNLESTKRMLDMAALEGIGRIVATPHFSYGMDADYRKKTLEAFQVVERLWKEMGKDKEFYLGNELFYSEGIIDELEAGKALTMNHTRYVLVEFPVFTEPYSIEKAVKNLRYANYIPILAHVERYGYWHRTEQIREYIQMGAYIQMNVSTIMGKHGFTAKHHAVRLLKQGLVHFVGTDAHNSRERRPEMAACMAYLNKKLGKERATLVLEENPENMLKGEELDG